MWVDEGKSAWVGMERGHSNGLLKEAAFEHFAELRMYPTK